MISIKNLIRREHKFIPPKNETNSPELLEDVNFMLTQGLKRLAIRRRNILFVEVCRYSAPFAKKRWNMNYTYFDYGERGQIKQIFQTNNLNSDGAKFWWEKIKENPSFAKILVDELEQDIAIAKEIAMHQIFSQGHWTLEEIKDIYKLYIDWFSQFFVIVWPWFGLDDMKAQYLEPALKKYYPEKYKELLEKILMPSDLPLSSIEQRDFLNVCAIKNHKEKEKALIKHKESYDFLALHQVDDSLFDLEYYRGRMNVLDDPEVYEKTKSDLERASREIEEASKLERSLNLPDDVKALIHLLRSFAYLRTNSIDHMMMAYRSFQKVFEKLANKAQISLTQLVFLTMDEWDAIIDGNSNVSFSKIADKRINDGYMYLVGLNDTHLLYGEDAKSIFQKIEPVTDIFEALQQQELKGVSAFKGVVSGYVRVIAERKLANNLKEGEILVTAMTAPDFVPAMKRSAAIITNEGGVLCHASIMSRELRKPCIIGTKVATEVLKDGDLVEVDADNGVVRIIEKK